MPEQRRNSAMISTLGGEFQRRYEAAFAWKSACSAFLALPGLRGLWPMSAVADTNPRTRDLSTNALHLTGTGIGFAYAGLIPYVGLGVGDTMLRTTEANLNIDGAEGYITAGARGLTLGGWFYSTDLQAGNIFLMCKWEAAANNRSYGLYHNTDDVTFGIYDLANNADTVTLNNQFTVNGWHFIVGRFDPSNEIKVFVDDQSNTNAVGIPAQLFTSTADFSVGARSDGTAQFYGRASMCFLCAMMLTDAVVMSMYHQTRAMFGR